MFCFAIYAVHLSDIFITIFVDQTKLVKHGMSFMVPLGGDPSALLEGEADGLPGHIHSSFQVNND